MDSEQQNKPQEQTCGTVSPEPISRRLSRMELRAVFLDEIIQKLDDDKGALWRRLEEMGVELAETRTKLVEAEAYIFAVESVVERNEVQVDGSNEVIWYRHATTAAIEKLCIERKAIEKFALILLDFVRGTIGAATWSRMNYKYPEIPKTSPASAYIFQHEDDLNEVASALAIMLDRMGKVLAGKQHVKILADVAPTAHIKEWVMKQEEAGRKSDLQKLVLDKPDFFQKAEQIWSSLTANEVNELEGKIAKLRRDRMPPARQAMLDEKFLNELEQKRVFYDNGEAPLRQQEFENYFEAYLKECGWREITEIGHDRFGNWFLGQQPGVNYSMESALDIQMAKDRLNLDVIQQANQSVATRSRANPNPANTSGISIPGVPRLEPGMNYYCPTCDRHVAPEDLEWGGDAFMHVKRTGDDPCPTAVIVHKPNQPINEWHPRHKVGFRGVR